MPSEAHGEIIEQDTDLADIGFKANINVNDPITECLAVRLKAKVQEEHIFDLIVVLVLIEVLAVQDLSYLGHAFHLAQSVMVIEVCHYIVDSVVAVVSNSVPSFINEHLQVVRGV